LRRQQQEYEHHRQAKCDDRGVTGDLLLQRDLGPLETEEAPQAAQNYLSYKRFRICTF
jgi:hypothetical protein